MSPHCVTTIIIIQKVYVRKEEKTLSLGQTLHFI